jgi:hypothetical protein
VVVVEFLMPDGSTCTYTKTTSKKPRHATKTKLHADSDCFTCTRATRANPNPKPKPPVVGIECTMDDVRCARVRCGVRRLLAAGGWPPPPPHTTDHRPQQRGGEGKQGTGDTPPKYPAYGRYALRATGYGLRAG